ncbi:signal peptidase I [uncultured Nitrospira sp.]|uniref:signal peptidase I n=1 Tax=uncultured Nitrospira sp. TaxID=157176 RepID=UPI00313FF616
MATQDPQQPKMTESSEKNLQEESSVASSSQEVEVSKKSIIREYAEALIIAIILALTIRVFVVQAFKIPSGSMIPTLMIGDHILVSKLSYGFQLPQDCEFQVSFPPVTCFSSTIVMNFDPPSRGDIIVFRYPEDENKDFIKRVIGLPGDTIHIQNKHVIVNGQPLLDEGFTQRVDPGIIDGRINPRDNLGPLTVPPESYFVMGDNRDQSLDSRFWGFVRMDKIKGRAFLVYWSWNGQGAWTDWIRWERIGKLIE